LDRRRGANSLAPLFSRLYTLRFFLRICIRHCLSRKCAKCEWAVWTNCLTCSECYQ
jgi:hypothetical protein